MAASTVAVPLAMMPARECQSAGRDSGTRVMPGPLALIDQALQKGAIERGRDRQQKFVVGAKLGGRFEDRRQVHAHFFDAAAGHQRDPLFCRIEMKLCGVVVALDGRVRQVGQGMADEGRVDSAVAIELFFEGKNHQRLVDVVAQQAHASLAPRPELRRDVVDHGNAALLHLPRHAPVEGGRVDDDGEIGLALVGFFDQMLEQAVDFWQMAENFGDADDGKIFRVDDGVAAGGAHALSADAEEFELRVRTAPGVQRARSPLQAR